MDIYCKSRHERQISPDSKAALGDDRVESGHGLNVCPAAILCQYIPSGPKPHEAGSRQQGQQAPLSP